MSAKPSLPGARATHSSWWSCCDPSGTPLLLVSRRARAERAGARHRTATASSAGPGGDHATLRRRSGGRDFDLGLLRVASELNPRGLVDTLDAARETSTILAADDRPGHYFVERPDPERLARDLSASQRARLHLRAAEVLEQRHPAGEGTPTTGTCSSPALCAPSWRRPEGRRLRETVERSRTLPRVAHADDVNSFSARALGSRARERVHPRFQAEPALGLSSASASWRAIQSPPSTCRRRRRWVRARLRRKT